MLIEFSVSNFRSIKNETCLSMVANNDTTLARSNTFKSDNHISLLRSAALYGPNAAGKSNLLRALNAMKWIVTQQRIFIKPTEISEDKLPVTPFLFDLESKKKPTFFEVDILIDGVRYQYGFTATFERIYKEWLYAFPKDRTQKWFYREYDHATGNDIFDFGNEFTGDKEAWQSKTRSTALFLSIAAQLNSQQLEPIFQWFSDTLRVYMHVEEIDSLKWCQGERKNEVIDFLIAADLPIVDLRVQEREVPKMLKENYNSVSEKFYFFLPIFTKIFATHKPQGGEPVEIEFDNESNGTKKMFRLAALWLDCLNRGGVLCIDEIHDDLHPFLVKYLVELFHNTKKNTKNAQLIFTTHETSILNLDIFRKDQIWFCEKDKQEATHFYPFSDFKSTEDIKDIERAYLAGRYDALPLLSKTSA